MLSPSRSFLCKLVFLFSSLICFVACTSINAEKYGFKGEYIQPFEDSADYIEPAGDAKPISYILKEVKNQEPRVLVRLTTGALGTWFNIANVKLTLPTGKTYILNGPIERWGSPTRTRTWTTKLSSVDFEKTKRLTTIINEKPSYDGQIYTWIDEYGYQSHEKVYRYRINTGRYNIRHESSMTYEALFAENLSDADLTAIAQAQTVDLVFTSRDPVNSPQEVKGIYNQPNVKGALMNYYFTTKEMLRVQRELKAAGKR